MQVLQCAFELGCLSNGAFDIGVGQFVDVWGLGAKTDQPDIEDISIALKREHMPAWRAITLDVKANRLLKTQPCSLNLNGIAKGFGVDALMAVVKRLKLKTLW